eukprot:7013229-Prymnesium_polylepis.1
MESQSRGMRDRVVAALQAYSATAAPPLDLCVLTGGVQARAYAQAFPFMCSDHPFFVNGRLMPSLIDALLPGEDGTSLRLADGSSAVFLCQLTDKRPTKAAPSRRRKAKGSSPSTGPVLGAPELNEESPSLSLGPDALEPTSPFFVSLGGVVRLSDSR